MPRAWAAAGQTRSNRRPRGSKLGVLVLVQGAGRPGAKVVVVGTEKDQWRGEAACPKLAYKFEIFLDHDRILDCTATSRTSVVDDSLKSAVAKDGVGVEGRKHGVEPGMPTASRASCSCSALVCRSRRKAVSRPRSSTA